MREHRGLMSAADSSCPACDAPLPPGARFCAACGRRVGPSSAEISWEVSDRRTFGAVSAMAGTAKRKHPSIAVNAAGDRLIAWAEGTAWARGGSVAWALRNQRGEQTDYAANAGGVPVWGLVSAIARPNGMFVIFH